MTFSEEELEVIVGECLDNFYNRRLQKLNKLTPRSAFRRKNPYLFKAIGTVNASELIKQILTAYMSSSDEGIFGDEFFEPLVKKVSGGKVSIGTGLDVEIHTEKSIKAIAVKSGTSVFNSSSKENQNKKFSQARKILFKEQKKFDGVIGYCYGNKEFRTGDQFLYREVAGQEFWKELTEDPNFYLKIIKFMKDRPEKHKAAFEEAWNKAENRFLREFLINFSDEQGVINWEAYVEFNSGKEGFKKYKSASKKNK